MNNVFKSKIILGSANFEQAYGIKKNTINRKEIKKLLNLAIQNKINIIDTSSGYNQSEKIIGSIGKSNFKIISKVPKIPKEVTGKNIKKWIKDKAKTSLKNLKVKKFDYLLLQDSKSLLGRNGDEIYKSIKTIKKLGLTKKIGISIYDFNELEKILNKFSFDLVQAPLSILDQRLLKTGWLSKLKNKKIKVHVRSIFLQGILLLKHNQLPRKLKYLKKNWIIWEKWLKKNKLTPLQACVSFIYNQNNLDGVVMGYNNKDQLDQILNQKNIKNKLTLPKINIKNMNFIDPRKWSNL